MKANSFVLAFVLAVAACSYWETSGLDEEVESAFIRKFGGSIDGVSRINSDEMVRLNIEPGVDVDGLRFEFAGVVITGGGRCDIGEYAVYNNCSDESCNTHFEEILCAHLH